jgi:large subunit ribosomal protein L10
MNRQQKELVVQLFRENFAQSPASFVVGYRGLTVNQMQDLRSKLRKQGGSLKITKARLMKLALGDQKNAEALLPYLHDQIGVVFVSKEPPAVAKVLSEFAKDHEALTLVVGKLDGDMLDSKGIVRIASLPSKPQLLALLSGTLKAPMNRLVFVLNMQVVQLLVVLKQIAEKKK